MKRVAALLLSLCILSGCDQSERSINKVLDFRKQLLSANGCTFSVGICADYGEEIYTFKMDCSGDETGKLSFTVTEPESIAGISGCIDDTAASLTFQDSILAFPLLADGQISPVSAPWLFLKTLRGGYLSACGKTDDGMVIAMDDSFSENALRVDIYTDTESNPVSAEIFWQQKRVICLEITKFTLL